MLVLRLSRVPSTIAKFKAGKSRCLFGLVTLGARPATDWKACACSFVNFWLLCTRPHRHLWL